MRQAPIRPTATTKPRYDVVVVGGGPGGLTGALMLARSRRQVLLVEHGRPRNHRTRAIHGYLTRPGIAPRTFQRLAHRDLEGLGVQRLHDEVTQVCPERDGFRLLTSGGIELRARKVLLATGVVDTLPDLPGAEACYGRSLFHCPYCDGWEARDAQLALLGWGAGAPGFAHLLAGWSRDLLLFTDGPARFSEAAAHGLAKAGITVVRGRIARLEHRRGRLHGIRLRDGTVHARSALFFHTRSTQHASLVNELGCRLYRSGMVITDRKQRTNVHGLYVAGDAAIGTHFVSVAAAEGAKAAVAINTELLEEDLAQQGIRTR